MDHVLEPRGDVSPRCIFVKCQWLKEGLKNNMANLVPKIELWDCFNCDEPVSVNILTGASDESPELYTVPIGAWIGMTTVEYDDGVDEDPTFIVCCSMQCCQEMLAGDEDDDASDEKTDVEEDGLQ